MYLRGILASVTLLIAAGAAGQATVSLDQLPRPEMQAFKLDKAPNLDGLVAGDGAWEGVVPTRGFTAVQPVVGAPASQETEVFIGFTDTALYVGVIAYDDDPSGIIVSDSRRDSSLDDSDSFRMVIDGLLDRQNAFLFGTNPAGVEYDAQITKEGVETVRGPNSGGVFNLNWDGSWNVVATITEVGWSAEFEIPFRTLRFGKGDNQSWGINFQRNIRRNNEIVYWAPITRERNLNRISEAGTVVGLSPPPTRNLQITPYALAQWERGGDLTGTDSNQEFGVDIKYSLTPSLTLDATYNTDFAQVEVDDVVVNLDRFSIFLPEKRPFFLENAGLFSVGNGGEEELFFSRRIGIVSGEQVAIDGGLRLSGKVGSATNVGFLYMADAGLDDVAPQNDYMVARVNQELPNRSSIGALVVSRQGDGSLLPPGAKDENRTYAIDGRWGVGKNLLFDGWYSKTDTPGLTGDDYAYSTKMSYDSSTWSAQLGYGEVREDFNPEVGFLLRDDYKRAEFYVMRRYRPEGALLEVRPHIRIRNFWDLDGFMETGFQHYDIHWEFKNGYQVDTGMNYVKDGLKDPFEIVDGVVVQPGTYSGTEAALHFRTDLSAPLSLQLRLNAGDKFGGTRVQATPTVVYRIGETFSSELSMVYNDFDLPVPGGEFSVTVTRLRLSYSFTPRMLLQALVQYNDAADTLSTNIRFSLLRTANSGLFVVYNEFDERLPGAPPNGREFIVKYSYMFDVFD